METRSLLPGRSAGLKLLLVCALALVMAVPALFVYAVVYDRQTRADEALAEISQAQGGPQTLVGPVLAVPYREGFVTSAPKPPAVDPVTGLIVATPAEPAQGSWGLFLIFAESGSAHSSLTVRNLRRGIQDIPVFDSVTRFTAHFEPEAAAAQAGVELDWSRARLLMGADDLRGASAPAIIGVGGESASMMPYANLPNALAGRAINENPYSFGARSLLADAFELMEASPAAIRSGAPFDVTAEMYFSGANWFSLTPFAKETQAIITGDWPDPSFGGGDGFLPDEREVSDAGFTAGWTVPFLARGVAASGEGFGVIGSVTGRPMTVQLLQPGNAYQAVQRALKYAVMFVGFVFLAYFLMEITAARPVHAAQYVLVGLAQSTFYLLLLALAEQVGFDLAFVIAAFAVIAQTALYAGAVFGARRHAVRAAAIFSVIYGLMYILMRLEDFALLAGALACFCALGAVMWITRDVDWYGAGGKPAAPATPAG